eukprot:m.117642 g.117642  ORF g.117642 m.117642 type:complete len:67 (+) comp13629_c1_seq9:5767-5967(+)
MQAPPPYDRSSEQKRCGITYHMSNADRNIVLCLWFSCNDTLLLPTVGTVDMVLDDKEEHSGVHIQA